MATGSETAALLHPEAVGHLPVFITPPGATDGLMIAMAVFMLMAIIGIGVFYLKLHSLPENMAHRGQKVQYEIVAVLGLLALLTHNNLFWIAGLLLAMVPIPNFSDPLLSMAHSLKRIADQGKVPPPEPERAPEPAAEGAGHA